jgi:hypothetical protein
MSDDSFDASTKGRTTESGAAVARGRTRHGGGGNGVVARIRPVATPSLSLPRSGAGRRAGINRELCHCHREDASKPRAQSARSCEQARCDRKRSCQARCCNVVGDETPAWLRGGRHSVPCISNTNSIDCSLANSNWLTTSWSLTGSGSSARQG